MIVSVLQLHCTPLSWLSAESQKTDHILVHDAAEQTGIGLASCTSSADVSPYLEGMRSGRCTPHGNLPDADTSTSANFQLATELYFRLGNDLLGCYSPLPNHDLDQEGVALALIKGKLSRGMGFTRGWESTGINTRCDLLVSMCLWFILGRIRGLHLHSLLIESCYNDTFFCPC